MEQSPLSHDTQQNSSAAITPCSRKDAFLPIYSVTPFTMLDFPDRTACVVWFSGCNMRCPYCHNPELVKGKGRGDISEVMAFLKKRAGLLDGVVLSGGEASLFPGLPDFIEQVKDLGYDVKIDTNGLRPTVIQSFLEKNYLDYIALDYKSPSYKFAKVTGVDKYDLFVRTLDMICGQDKVPYEIRTTVHTDLLDESDITCIIEDLDSRGYTGTYYVQNFRADNGRQTLGLMRDQVQTLDIAALPVPKNFNIDFRNF